MPLTIVAVHAHPDDESLYTGGTLAKLSAAGHRVVLVTATDGAVGLADRRFGTATELGATRRAELHRAAQQLGCAEVICLGHHDSGSGAESTPVAGRHAFADVPTELVAQELAEILRREAADVVLIYDENGGYLHRDHQKVHRAGSVAATLAGVSVVLEATVDRTQMVRIAKVLAKIPGLTHLIPENCFTDAYTPAEQITHRVDVRPWVNQKQAALRAHASQQSGGGIRTVALLAHLPWPISRWVLGTEWYRQQGVQAGLTNATDLFDS